MWMRAWRYDSFELAGEVWRGIRDYIFKGNVDASVYRVLLDGVPHVAVIGEGQLTNRFIRAMEVESRGGKVVDLPDEVFDQLFHRRMSGSIPGVFWERRGMA